MEFQVLLNWPINKKLIPQCLFGRFIGRNCEKLSAITFSDSKVTFEYLVLLTINPQIAFIIEHRFKYFDKLISLTIHIYYRRLQYQGLVKMCFF